MWTSKGVELLYQLHLLILKSSQSLSSPTVLLVTYPGSACPRPLTFLQGPNGPSWSRGTDSWAGSGVWAGAGILRPDCWCLWAPGELWDLGYSSQPLWACFLTYTKRARGAPSSWGCGSQAHRTVPGTQCCSELATLLFSCWWGEAPSNRAACGILVPRAGIEPAAPTVEAQNPNHGIFRQVPGCYY